MIYRIRKALISDRFEKIKFILNIILLAILLCNLYFNVAFEIKLNVHLSFAIMLISLIEIPLSTKARKLKLKREALEELIDEYFLELLDIANRMSNEPKMTINLYITINAHRISALFVKGCQESLLSYDEYVFIMNCLNSIPSFIKEVK